MLRPQPFNIKELRCDICGKPAKWYDRFFGASYRLGEALCDECAIKDAEFFSKVRTELPNKES